MLLTFIIGLENQHVVFVRVAVLDRFYITKFIIFTSLDKINVIFNTNLKILYIHTLLSKI